VRRGKATYVLTQRSPVPEFARLCLAQGRLEEAEGFWRGLAQGQPGCVPSWQGLGEVCLARQRWAALEEAAARLVGSDLPARLEALVLPKPVRTRPSCGGARWHLRAPAASNDLPDQDIQQAVS
jgi:hypothetical protein